MPELSVVLCVKDGEDTVRHAVTSTLRAMPRDAELVVLDDASSDDTIGVLSHIRDRRLRIESSTTRLGPARARQRLIEITDSRYVATMDADDVSLPWRFTASKRFLGRTGADMVFTQVVPFRGGLRFGRPGLPVSIGSRILPLLLLIGDNLYHPTLYARRSTIDEAGGYADCTCEDYELWMRAATHGARIARWGGTGLAYRHHGGQVSKSQDMFARAEAEGVLPATRREFRSALFGLTGDPKATELLETLGVQLRERGATRRERFAVEQFSRQLLGAAPPMR